MRASLAFHFFAKILRIYEQFLKIFKGRLLLLTFVNASSDTRQVLHRKRYQAQYPFRIIATPTWYSFSFVFAFSFWY